MDLKAINRANVYPLEGGGEGSGNPPDFLGMGIVAFIDLLGFSADVEGHWGDGDDSPLARLMRIKGAAKKISDQKTIAYIPGGQIEQKFNEARVHTISDSIVICSALPQSGNQNALTMAMTTVLQGVQMAWAAAIKEGYTIRGAMELGPIFWSEKEAETLGPAFIWAYTLEGKVAKASRVIIGPLFLKNLLDRMNPDWADWPSSNWFSVSYDGLIELSVHELKRDLKNLEGLIALQAKAGDQADRYDHIIKVLQADNFHKATPADLKIGMLKTRQLMLKPKP